MMSLLQRGLLKLTESRDWTSIPLAIRREVDRGRQPEPGELAPIEARIVKWPGFPATGRQIYQGDDSPSESGSTPSSKGAAGRYAKQHLTVPLFITGRCRRYQRTLLASNLLAPPEMRRLGSLLWCLGTALIVSVGGYLLTAALAKGEPLTAGVLCLVPVACVGIIALTPACLCFPRVSHRGRAYLEQLEDAYDRLRSLGRPRCSSKSAVTKAVNQNDKQPIRESSVFSDRLLMDGIFGDVSPADTPLNGIWTTMVRIGMVYGPGEESPVI